MSSLTFKTRGARQPAVESFGPMPLADVQKGMITIDAKAVRLGSWIIPIPSITSAMVRTQYHFSVASYSLLLSDGTYNYLFHLPGQHAGYPYPFPVQREVEKPFGGRYGMLILVGTLLALQVISGFME